MTGGSLKPEGLGETTGNHYAFIVLQTFYVAPGIPAFPHRIYWLYHLALATFISGTVTTLCHIATKNIFECDPHNDLLSDRQANEAYCIANPGKEYAGYFTICGEVTLDAGSMKKPAALRWLDIMKSNWSDAKKVQAKGTLKLQCPSPGYWAALIK